MAAVLIVLIILMLAILYHVLTVDKKAEDTVNTQDSQAGEELKIPVIETEYFEESKRISGKLYRFFMALNDDRAVINFLHSNVEGLEEIDIKGNIFPYSDPRLTFMMMMDMTHVSKSLGVDIEKRTPEMLPLYMLLMRIIDDNRSKMDVFLKFEIFNEGIERLVSMLTTISRFRPKDMPADLLYLGNVLYLAFPEEGREFHKLLYEYAKKVADVKGQLSVAERSYLESLSPR